MEIIYNLTIYPLEILYKYLYLFIFEILGSFGFSLIGLSLVSFILSLPLAKYAKKFHDRELETQAVLTPQIDAIKADSQGAERHLRLNGLYKRYSYHPIYAIRSVAGLLVQVPFLVAAYLMLSNLTILQGQSFFIVRDLSAPDGLLGGVNLLPWVMTLVNLASVYFYTPGVGRREKVQLYGLALFFLVILYNASSALVFYWTCTNVLTLVKNIFAAKIQFPVWAGFSSKKAVGLSVAFEGRATGSTIFIPSLISSFLLTMCIFFYIPFSTYWRNINEFPFNGVELVLSYLSYIVIFFVLITSGLYGISKLFSKRSLNLVKSGRRLLISPAHIFVLVLVLLLIIEGTFMSIGLPLLTGELGLFRSKARIGLDIFLWGGVLLLGLYFWRKIASKFKIIAWGCTFLMAATGVEYFTNEKKYDHLTNDVSQQSSMKPTSRTEVFAGMHFHSEKNIIIIMVDALDIFTLLDALKAELEIQDNF